MIAGLDDILRRILGMQKQPNDDAGVFDPPSSVQPPGIAEGEMAPMNDYDIQRYEMLGNSQTLPYVPGNNLADDAGPGPIPLNNNPSQQFRRGPEVPLQRGNAKRGSGIDI